MNTVTGVIHERGVVVRVYVGWSQGDTWDAESEGKVTVEPEEVDAQIDTGASITIIDKSIADALGLPLKGTVKLVDAVHGKVDTKDLHHVCLWLKAQSAGPAKYHDRVGVAVTEDLSQQGFKALLGRDILASYVFSYNGKTNTYALQW